MRVIKAAFSKTFPITQYYEKVYLEAELNEGDDARQVLYDLKKQVQSFFYESNAAAEKQMGAQVIEVSEEKKISLPGVAEIIKQINTCTELKVLESYKFIVRNDGDMQAAYDKKIREFIKIPE